MKETEVNNSARKLKFMLRGTSAAKYSSIFLIILTLILIYKMRGETIYILTLIAGAGLVIWYTVRHLVVREINSDGGDLTNNLKLFREHLLKREKYESSIFFLWSLTVIPAYLYGKEINLLVLLSYMTITFYYTLMVKSMFRKAKKDLRDLEIKS